MSVKRRLCIFGKRLRDARIKKGYTQPQCADHLEVALRTYQCYEGGTRYPSFEVLLDMGEVLNTSIDYLMGRDIFLSSHGVSVDVFQTNPQEHPML